MRHTNTFYWPSSSILVKYSYNSIIFRRIKQFNELVLAPPPRLLLSYKKFFFFKIKNIVRKKEVFCILLSN